MELTEPVDSINKQLVDHFGTDTITGLAMWRVVFSEDQFEKRLGTYDDFTPSGIYLRTVTEVREVPKYRQWIKRKYVLENLVLIPDINKKELPGPMSVSRETVTLKDSVTPQSLHVSGELSIV